MVELLVALVISLLIALAAIAALTVTRQGFQTVDAASQLRDNGRFSADLIQRLAVQSGYKNTWEATIPSTVPLGPYITGFNNALIKTSDPLNATTTRPTGQDGFGSDILILRYQAAETFLNSGKSDQSMIGCTGNSPTNIAGPMISIIHVAISQGEPSLMCSYSADGGFSFTTAQPIVQGVENFQVLYGTDGVTAGTAPTATTDAIPDRLLRSDQLTVSGNASATDANWRRVRSLRIGMILRGPLNSAQEKVAQTLYPFGLAKSSSTGTAGAAMSNTITLDPGTAFTTPADGRLRQVLTFTVHLRNDQGT